MESCFELLAAPVKIVPASPLSDDHFMAFSRAHRPYRFEKTSRGEIIMMTPAGNRSDEREADLVTELKVWSRVDGRGRVNGANAGWNLPDGSTRSPDASWTPEEKLQQFSAKERESFLPTCPEFIAEIRSQSDSMSILQEKMEVWMANGAHLGWLIDPYSATVHIYRPGIYRPGIYRPGIYRPGREAKALNKPEILEGEGPVAGFRLEMERFWA